MPCTIFVLVYSIDVEIRSRSLTGVVGQVGAGKSSLLSAVLGEMEKISGHVNVSVSFGLNCFNLMQDIVYSHCLL